LEENEKVDARAKPASWRRKTGGEKTSSFGDVAKFCIDSKVLQTVESSGVGCLVRGSDQRKPRSVVASARKGRWALRVEV